jgi:hypothetical protein
MLNGTYYSSTVLALAICHSKNRVKVYEKMVLRSIFETDRKA